MIKSKKELRQSGHQRVMSKYTWKYLAKTQWEDRIMSLLKEKKFVPNLCELCDKHFPNAFEFFKHKAETHKPLEGRLHDSNPRVFVKLIMSRYVEVGINGTRYDGKELLVPEESASDITRIISEAYGSDTIIDAKVQLVKLNS